MSDNIHLSSDREQTKQPLYEGVMPQEVVVDNEVSLRLLATDDAQRIFEILELDPDIRKYVGLFQDCKTIDVLRDKITDQMAHGSLRYAITLQGELVGYVGIWQDPDEKDFAQYNISDFLAKEARGQGIMGRSLEVLLQSAQQKLKVDRFSAWVEEGNESSARVLERLGFKRTDVAHKNSQGKISWDYIREVAHG